MNWGRNTARGAAGGDEHSWMKQAVPLGTNSSARSFQGQIWARNPN